MEFIREMTEGEKSDPVLNCAYYLEMGVVARDPEKAGQINMEYLDDRDFIVNVKVEKGQGSSPDEDVELADCLASTLAQVIVKELGEEWSVVSTPNWWGKNGEELDTGDESEVDIVQYQICKE